MYTYVPFPWVYTKMQLIDNRIWQKAPDLLKLLCSSETAEEARNLKSGRFESV
jgi:hypothetical protein